MSKMGRGLKSKKKVEVVRFLDAKRLSLFFFFFFLQLLQYIFMRSFFFFFFYPPQC